MSNIDEQLSAHTRRRIPYNQIAGIIDRVIDYDITPSWYDDKGDFIADVCDYIVDYFNEDDHIELTPKDKDAFYYYLVDTYGEYLSNYYDQWKKGVRGSLSEQSDRIKSMMGVISEDMSIAARRRVKFGDIEKNLKDIKVKSFKKDQPIEDSVRAAILSLLYSVMPEGFEEDDVEYYKVWDEIKKYINNKYGEELRRYFEKRQMDADQETEDIKYIFVKHDKSYYDKGWKGFAEGFDSFSDLLTRYGDWVDVDWDEVKRKLDTINDYPENTFTGTMNSRPLRISNIGDEGNDWGYNFSIIKQIPKDGLNENKTNVNESKRNGSVQKFVNSSLESLRSEMDEMGLGEMDELDEIGSIEKIVVDKVVRVDNSLVISIDIYSNSDRTDFTNTVLAIEYDLSKFIPVKSVVLNNVIEL